MTVRLIPLQCADPDYQHAEKLFRDGWKHADKDEPEVRTIFKIVCTEEALKPYLKYRKHIQRSLPLRLSIKTENPGNEGLRFHGTNRACLLGEDTSNVRPCFLSKCFLCCIIRNSFDVAQCGSKHQFARFGAGIYTTAVSSKADDYCENLSKEAIFRVMLLSRVVIGKPSKQKENDMDLTGPPAGYHSILGKSGQDLNYEENVVYRNDAIRPAYVLVYGTAPKVDMEDIGRFLFKTRSASYTTNTVQSRAPILFHHRGNPQSFKFQGRRNNLTEQIGNLVFQTDQTAYLIVEDSASSSEDDDTSSSDGEDSVREPNPLEALAVFSANMPAPALKSRYRSVQTASDGETRFYIDENGNLYTGRSGLRLMARRGSTSTRMGICIQDG